MPGVDPVIRAGHSSVLGSFESVTRSITITVPSKQPRDAGIRMYFLRSNPRGEPFQGDLPKLWESAHWSRHVHGRFEKLNRVNSHPIPTPGQFQAGLLRYTHEVEIDTYQATEGSCRFPPGSTTVSHHLGMRTITHNHDNSCTDGLKGGETAFINIRLSECRPPECWIYDRC